MLVRHVEARSFRCYEHLAVDLEDGVTVIAGRNGAGKTSLIEAAHFGCTGYSPRTSVDAQCIRDGADHTRVEVSGITAGRPCLTSVAFQPGRAKRVRADGATLRSADLLGERWACLVFTPDRLALVKRSPALRRAYVDRALTRLRPAFGRTTQAYASALAQRNALLRRVRAGVTSASALAPWDAQIATLGAEITGARAWLTGRLAPLFVERMALLGGAEEDVRLGYVPRGSADAEELLVALEQRRAVDVARAVTGVGPHLDDVSFVERARDVRAYGSQGEQRTVVLALLLAEAALLRERRGETPVLLLDDVLSELDQRRRGLLLEAIRAHGQAVITTADPDDLPGQADAVLEVDGGLVRHAGRASTHR